MNIEERTKQAIGIFGKGIVMTVTELVNVSDPDGVYTLFEDMNMHEEAECTSYIYFEH